MKFTRKMNIENYQEIGRVVMLYGPRRIGKTTMAKEYLEKMRSLGFRVKYEIGDDLNLQNFFAKQSRKDILLYANEFDVLVIDESQNIENIGIVAKIIIDEFPNKKIILTGSSSFALAQQTGEPLVGRQYLMTLLPVAFAEIEGSNYEKNQYLNNFMTYGFYPEVLLAENFEEKKFKLNEIISSYLFKDILALDKIKSPELLLKIVKALAYQIGSEVTINKLTKDVGESDPKKITRYLDILQKTFVIKKVNAYSTNLRNEINKPCKYYFYDLGIRNSVIGNLSPIDKREKKEVGNMWENFVFMELTKLSNINRQVFDNFYFWRNKINNKEVDIVKTDGEANVFAYECKWGKEVPSFKQFLENYKNAKVQVVNPENYLDIL